MNTWKAVLVLARSRLRIARNTLWRVRLRQKITLIMLLIGVGALIAGIYAFSTFLVDGIQHPDVERALSRAIEEGKMPLDMPDPVLLLTALPSGALFVASLVIIFSSFSSILNTLYLSGDMDMLLTRPVPMRAVFIVKFFQSLVTQYGLLFILLAPALLGYGHALGYGALYMLTLVIILLTLPLLPTGLGALLVMLVVRVIPAARARELVSVLGGLLAVSIYVLSQFAPEVVPHVASGENVDTLLALNMPVLPWAWAGRALLAAGQGAVLPLLLYGGLFLLLSLLLFGGCLVIAEHLYYAGWSNMAPQGGHMKRRSSTGAVSQPAGQEQPAPDRWRLLRPWSLLMWAWSSLEPRSAAVFFKDSHIFPRDLRNVQQLIFPLALAGIWIFRLLTMSEEETSAAEVEMLTGLSSIGITFFLCYTLSSAVAGPGIGREGRAFWLLKLAPISPLHILLGKLVLAYLPYLLIGTPLLALLVLFSHTPLLEFLAGWGLLLLLGLGNTCLLLGLGATFPRVDWENPQQQTTMTAGCLGAVLSPLYIVLVLVSVLGLPVLVEFFLGQIGRHPLVDASGWLIAVLITFVVLGASLWFGARGLERMDL
jgi:ABC-2 type transport system permease protein